MSTMEMTKLKLIVNSFWAISTMILLFLDVEQDGALLANSNFLWGYVGCMVLSFIVVSVVEKRIYRNNDK